MNPTSPIDAFLKELEICLYTYPDVSQVEIVPTLAQIGYEIRIRYDRTGARSSFILQLAELIGTIQSGDIAKFGLMQAIVSEAKHSYDEYLQSRGKQLGQHDAVHIARVVELRDNPAFNGKGVPAPGILDTIKRSKG